MIIGDRQTGKTAIAVDTIINQRGQGVVCIYVAIGQKLDGRAARGEAQPLWRDGIPSWWLLLHRSSAAPSSMHRMHHRRALPRHRQTFLIIYDDLSKHATAYRQLSLLLRRPPGREAYPGDVFYLHSRLLERAAKMSDEAGAGSLTALPIIETQAGDVSAYIPTNVISITDGQIVLDIDLFNSNVRPAVNVGLSVSRVGFTAAIKAMKQVGATMKLDLAQYREMAAFAQFGSELDASSQRLLNRGARVTEVLKQDQYKPVSTEKEVLIVFAANEGYLDKLEVSRVRAFETGLNDYFDARHADLLTEIKEKRELTDDLRKRLAAAVDAYLKSFQAEHAKGAAA